MTAPLNIVFLLQFSFLQRFFRRTGFQVARRIFSPQNVETPFATLIPFQHFATPYRAWLYISQLLLLLGITLLYDYTRRMNMYISTHTPHTGCDKYTEMYWKGTAVFQLTHPTRGATPKGTAVQCAGSFQLTHPTRGATLHIAKNRIASTIWSGQQ